MSGKVALAARSPPTCRRRSPGAARPASASRSAAGSARSCASTPHDLLLGGARPRLLPACRASSACCASTQPGAPTTGTGSGASDARALAADARRDGSLVAAPREAGCRLCADRRRRDRPPRAAVLLVRARRHPRGVHREERRLRADVRRPRGRSASSRASRRRTRSRSTASSWSRSTGSSAAAGGRSGARRSLVAAATALLVYEIGRRVLSPTRRPVRRARRDAQPVPRLARRPRQPRDPRPAARRRARSAARCVAADRRSAGSATAAGIYAGLAILGNARLSCCPLVVAVYLLCRQRLGLGAAGRRRRRRRWWSTARGWSATRSRSAASRSRPTRARSGRRTTRRPTTCSHTGSGSTTCATRPGTRSRTGGGPRHLPPDRRQDPRRRVRATMRYYQDRAWEFVREHPGEKAKLAVQAVRMQWDPPHDRVRHGFRSAARSATGRSPSTRRSSISSALIGIFVGRRRLVALALALLAYQTLAAMVFVGATRYRVTTDFIIALLGSVCAGVGAVAPTRISVKVLHVHRIGGIGGSERHLLTLLPALAERGVDVSFLGLDDPSRAPDPFYEALVVPYERLSAPRDLDPRLALRVRRATRKADLVHTHLVHGDVYGALGARRLVSTKHNDDPFRAGPFRVVERAPRPQASAVIAITRRARTLPGGARRAAGGQGAGHPLRPGRSPGALGRQRGGRCPRGRTHLARSRAPGAAEGDRRGCARATGDSGDPSRCSPRRPRGGTPAHGVATARDLARRSRPPARPRRRTWLPGYAAPTCSSTRPAGKGSASRYWRQCSPPSPSSRRT